MPRPARRFDRSAGRGSRARRNRPRDDAVGAPRRRVGGYRESRRRMRSASDRPYVRAERESLRAPSREWRDSRAGRRAQRSAPRARCAPPSRSSVEASERPRARRATIAALSGGSRRAAVRCACGRGSAPASISVASIAPVAEPRRIMDRRIDDIGALRRAWVRPGPLPATLRQSGNLFVPGGRRDSVRSHGSRHGRPRAARRTWRTRCAPAAAVLRVGAAGAARAGRGASWSPSGASNPCSPCVSMRRNAAGLGRDHRQTAGERFQHRGRHVVDVRDSGCRCRCSSRTRRSRRGATRPTNVTRRRSSWADQSAQRVAPARRRRPGSGWPSGHTSCTILNARMVVATL